MPDANNIVIEGRLTDKAQNKNHNNKDFVTFRVASTEYVKSNSDKKTTFIDCEWWEPNGAAQYLEKGKTVLIVGRLSQSEWTDAEGKKRSRHYIKVDRLDLRSSPKKEDSPKQTEDNLDEFAASLSEVPF